MFRCKVTGNAGTKAIGRGSVPRKCGASAKRGIAQGDPSNCTVGAMTPFYWMQKNGNNVRPASVTRAYMIAAADGRAVL